MVKKFVIFTLATVLLPCTATAQTQAPDLVPILKSTIEHYAERERQIQKLPDDVPLAVSMQFERTVGPRGPALDPEVAVQARANDLARVARELGFPIGAADALKRCRPVDGGWERCEVAGAAGVVAIGRILVDGDRAAVELRGWRPASYPPFAHPRARVLASEWSVVRLERRGGGWEAIGAFPPGMKVRTLGEWW